MKKLMQHVALVSQSNSVTLAEATKVAAALQKQVSNDFEDVWDIHATVAAFDSLDDVPASYWPVTIVNHVKDAAGIHLDDHGEPYALVGYDSQWSLTASHEVLEMLVDPMGSRMTSGKNKYGPGNVRYLVEVCDPSEDAKFGYEVNGVLVSDFYTPHFFDKTMKPGAAYSFTNAIKKPLDVLEGGYLSWYDPASGEWFQETFFGGAGPEKVTLGKLGPQPRNNIRLALKNARVREGKKKAMTKGVPAGAVAGAQGNLKPAHKSVRARMLQKCMDDVIG